MSKLSYHLKPAACPMCNPQSSAELATQPQTRDEIVPQLVNYIRTSLDEDQEYAGLDEHTLLYETGLLSSMKIGRLLGYIRVQFGVEIPVEVIEYDTFRDVNSLADAVLHQLNSTTAPSQA